MSRSLNRHISRHILCHNQLFVIIIQYVTVQFRPASQPALFMPLYTAIELVLPADRDHELEDLAFDLVSSSGALAGLLHPAIRAAVGDLVRSMNCYYSNLIEGHNTLPHDIERALAKDYSSETGTTKSAA
jgi:hypothetical protein